MESQYLVIVESPAKATTIEQYLARRQDGRRWVVTATRGHICDLPRESLGITSKNGHFFAQWRLGQGSRSVLARISGLARSAEIVYIATDPDREGEKIAADLVRNAKLDSHRRIIFREITEHAINAAVDHQNDIVCAERVDAQVARRLVDRQIGYPLSDVIYWAFKQVGATAMPRGIGRVISPALRVLCAAEERIEDFIPETYSRIAVDYSVGKAQFRLLHPLKFMEGDGEALDAVVRDLSDPHVVANYYPRTKEKSPYAPLTTARLQRLAFYLLHMAPEKTMRLAQELYEGVDLPGGRHGLITYPRTDGVQIADEAVAHMVGALEELVETDSILAQKRCFKNRANAQGAHEAIRPTLFSREFWPSSIAPHVSKDAYDLYNLIWMRTLQTQMTDSVYDTSLVQVACGEHVLAGQANERIFAGWEDLGGDQFIAAEESEEAPFHSPSVHIPRLRITEVLSTAEVRTISLDTTRPRRFGIGRFLTTVDGYGIARPSTLDTVVPSLEAKGYVNVRHGILYPTRLGRLVDDWTAEHAGWLSDPEQAVFFEAALDSVESGQTGPDELIAQYVARIKELKDSIGYVARGEGAPSEDALAYALQLATQQGIELPQDARVSASSLSRFISAHRPERDVLGKCPLCADRSVTVYEKLFACASRSCEFRLWLSDTTGFIAAFQLQLSANELVGELLKRKRTLFERLVNKRGQEFSAYLAIRQRTGTRSGSLPSWEIRIDGFPRKKRASSRASEPEF